MAKIIPDGWRELVVTGGAQREIETLAVLASELPETYRPLCQHRCPMSWFENLNL